MRQCANNYRISGRQAIITKGPSLCSDAISLSTIGECNMHASKSPLLKTPDANWRYRYRRSGIPKGHQCNNLSFSPIADYDKAKAQISKKIDKAGIYYGYLVLKAFLFPIVIHLRSTAKTSKPRLNESFGQ